MSAKGRMKSIRDISNIIYAIANWDPDFSTMARNFRKSIEPKYYPQIYKTLNDLLRAVFKGQTFEWAYKQAENIQDDIVRIATQSALLTLEPYVENRRWVSFFNDIPAHEFQASADVKIPIKIFGILQDLTGHSLVVFCCWKKGLCHEQLRILASLVRYYADQYPELKNCRLEVIDLSCDKPKGTRSLKIHTWETLPIFNSEDLNKITKLMADAYLWAAKDFEENPPPKKPKKRRPGERGDTIEMFPDA